MPLEGKAVDQDPSFIAAKAAVKKARDAAKEDAMKQFSNGRRRGFSPMMTRPTMPARSRVAAPQGAGIRHEDASRSFTREEFNKFTPQQKSAYCIRGELPQAPERLTRAEFQARSPRKRSDFLNAGGRLI